MNNHSEIRAAAGGFRSLLVVAAVLALLALGGCRRDHLYYGSEQNALIRINLDWSYTGWEPNGASVYAYDALTGALVRRFDPFSNPNGGYISLPVGIYNLVAFNNTPPEFADKLLFLDDDRWEMFRTEASLDTKAYARSNAATVVAASSRANDVFANEPDSFAVARYEHFEVTEEMAHKYYYDPEVLNADGSAKCIWMTPRKAISKFVVKAHVKGLKYAKAPIYAYLRGLSKGYYMCLGHNTADPCTHAFILNNRTWDPGSTKDGTVSAAFNTFGVIPDGVTRSDGKNGLILDIDFNLTDGSSFPVSFDVTDAVEYTEVQVGLDLSIQLNVMLTLDIEIELPTVIGGDDEDPEGGFSPDVSDWDDKEVPLPL